MRRVFITLEYIKAISAAFCALVLSLALISYYPEDQSVIYDASGASSEVNTRNYLGLWGAQVAGLLIYVLGGTAWILVGIGFYLSYRCISKTVISTHMHYSYGTHSLLAFFVSMLISAYIQFYPGAGGVYLLECLHALLEPWHVVLLLYCLLLALSVLCLLEIFCRLLVCMRMHVRALINYLLKK